MPDAVARQRGFSGGDIISDGAVNHDHRGAWRLSPRAGQRRRSIERLPPAVAGGVALASSFPGTARARANKPLADIEAKLCQHHGNDHHARR